MEPQLYEAGLLQEAVVPTALPWISWVTAAWIMSRSSWVRTMFVSQVGPSHWAWADPIKRRKKIGIIALISRRLTAAREGKSADQRWSALLWIPSNFFISHLRIDITGFQDGSDKENLALGQNCL